VTSKRQGMRKRGQFALATKKVNETLVKAIANALRNQILAILGERKGSAKGISKELGIDYWQVNYEMEVLREARLIRKVGERKRRGATEIFYEATARAYLDPSEWPKVADPVKAGLRASLFQNLLVDAATAICEETYDSREDAHMSWSPLIVDEQGWDELTETLYRALEDTLRIHEESGERLTARDEEGISCTVSILGYPSAVDKRRVGLPVDATDLIHLMPEDDEADATGDQTLAQQETPEPAKAKGKRKTRKASAKAKRRKT